MPKIKLYQKPNQELVSESQFVINKPERRLYNHISPNESIVC